MLSINEGAAQILSDSPGRIYFLTGADYGIKQHYINRLSSLYNDNLIELGSMQEFLLIMSHRSILPKPATLYVVRYDAQFISDLDEKLADKVKSFKFKGTLIGLYEKQDAEKKLDKFFPDCTVRINPLPDDLKVKHLSKEFSDLSDRLIRICVENSDSYARSMRMCEALNLAPIHFIDSVSKSEIKNMFGCSSGYDSELMKKSVANRDCATMYLLADSHDQSDYSSMFYDMLNALSEIAKSIEAGKPSGWVTSNMLNVWNWDQVIAMFDIVYEQLKLIRSDQSYSQVVSIYYCIGMLAYRISR